MAEPATDTGLDGSYGSSFGAMATDASRATKAYADVTREKVNAEGAISGEMQRRGEEDRNRALEAYKKTGIGPEEFKPWNAEIEHKKYESEPLQGFASSGAVFAMIASAFTKAPMLSAIEGMAGALNGIKQGNEEHYTRAFESYKENVKTAKAKHEIEHQAYTDALALGSHDLALSNAKLRAEAARFGDKQILALAENGMVKEIYDAIAARNKAMESASTLAEHTTRRTLEQQVLKTGYAAIDAMKGPPGPDGQPTEMPAEVKASLKMRQFNTTMASGKMTTPQQLGMMQLFIENPTMPVEKVLEIAEKHNIIKPAGGNSEAARQGKDIRERAAQIVEEGKKRGEEIPFTVAEGQAKTEAKAKSDTAAARRRTDIEGEARKLRAEDPDLSQFDAMAQAERDYEVKSKAPSPNRIDDLRHKINQADNVIIKGDKVLAFLSKYKGGAGLFGKIMRGEEVATNIAGISTQSDRVQMRRDIIDIQKILPEVMAARNGKVLKSDQDKIDAIVPALAAGDTGPNTIRGLRELLIDVKKRKKDFSGQITSGFDPDKSSSGAEDGDAETLASGKKAPPPNWLDMYPTKGGAPQRGAEGLSMSQYAEQVQNTTGKVQVNPDAWNRMMNETEPSSNIEDRRTSDDVKYEILYDRFQRGEYLSESDRSWLKSEHLLQQIKDQSSIDDYNESRGFKVKRARKPRPQE